MSYVATSQNLNDIYELLINDIYKKKKKKFFESCVYTHMLKV